MNAEAVPQPAVPASRCRAGGPKPALGRGLQDGRFKGHKTTLVADVDCTAGGEPLCTAFNGRTYVVGFSSGLVAAVGHHKWENHRPGAVGVVSAVNSTTTSRARPY